MAATHHLKCWPHFFAAVASGEKRFELRKNDRDFKAGDFLILEEYDPQAQSYTGRAVGCRVTYCTEGEWLAPGHVAMSLGPVKPYGEAFETHPKNSL